MTHGHQLIVAGASGFPGFGGPGDRGCVSCGFIAKLDEAPSPSDVEPRPDDRKMFVADGRGRYWCLDCATSALANVRRRTDERTAYDYPWRFEATGGPNGQRRIPEITCPTCHGYKKLCHDDYLQISSDCWRCNGKGTVPQETP